MVAEDEGAARIREATSDPWFFDTLTETMPEPSVSAALEEHFHLLDATQIHEAGHAVAMTLAGEDVWMARIGDGSGGEAGLVLPESARGGRIAYVDELDARLGPRGLARKIVTTFAGPLAELRFNPRRVSSGWGNDSIAVKTLTRYLNKEHRKLDVDWRGEGWEEACRMILDSRVWAAISEIAGDFKRRPPKEEDWQRPYHYMTGAKVRRIVARHLPEGWQWNDSLLPSGSRSR